MSNNEIFDKFFETISKKIINEFLTDINIIKLSDNKYKYSTNIKKESIIKSINDNIDNISVNISKHLEIKDVESVKQIILSQINTDIFNKQISKLYLDFTTSKKLSVIQLKKIYYKHLTASLIQGDIKEKIFALSQDTTFKNWLLRRWKIVGCGYAIILLILSITYYVFINKK